MTMPHSTRNGKKVRLVAVHTAEGARTAGDLERFFLRTQNASSHVGIDAAGVDRWLSDDVAAWTIRAGNPVSVNAELCAFAAWNSTQWASTSSVQGCANPAAILENTSRWIAEACVKHNIPIRKLDPAQVRAGLSGVIGHIDWTIGMSDGSHTDPGPSMLWEQVINRARQIAAGNTTSPATAPTPPAYTQEDRTMLVTKGTDRAVIPATGATALYIGIGYNKNVKLDWTGIGATPADSDKGAYKGGGKGWTFNADRPGPVQLQPGTVAVSLGAIEADDNFTAWCA